MDKTYKVKKIPPQVIILLSFLGVILIGAISFCMPFATNNGKGLNFLEALYLSTSATCVTGLTTVSAGDSLNLFGRIVLACLMEVGGLSFLTIMTFFFSIFGAKIQIRNSAILKEYLNQDKLGSIKSVVKKTVIIALIIQTIGAGLIMMILYFKYKQTIWVSLEYSVFHSISAFNNAGIDVFSGLSAGSLIPFRKDWAFLSVTMFLIIFGGLGFICIQEVLKKRRWTRFSLQTKLVLLTTAILLVGGTFAYFGLFKMAGQDVTILDCMFLSVTTRTAGFTSIDMNVVASVPAAHVLTIILMFIGASPCSTGGGFKTTSVAIIVISIIAYSRNKTPAAFKRKIPNDVARKTLVLFTTQIVYITSISLLIIIIENGVKSGITFQQTLFEVVSAFETVGLSEAGSANFHIVSQILIIITMFFGRLGPLTLLSIWNDKNSRLKETYVKYVEESVVIG